MISPPTCDGAAEMSARHGPAPPTSASTASPRMISDATSAMPLARAGLAARSAIIHARQIPAISPSLTHTTAPNGATNAVPKAAHAEVAA